jgi:hypothetical protein
MASTIKQYSFEVKASDWKTGEDGRRYFVNPITGKRRYAGEPNHRVKFTKISQP